MSVAALQDATNYCDDCCETEIFLLTSDNTIAAYRHAVITDEDNEPILNLETVIADEGTPANIENGNLILNEETFGTKWTLGFYPNIKVNKPNSPTWPISSVNGNLITQMESVERESELTGGNYNGTYYHLERDGDTYTIVYID